MAVYPNANIAAKFNCGLCILFNQLSAFDPAGFSFAMWLKWRDPNFTDPCFVNNNPDPVYWTTSRTDAYIFGYNNYQDSGHPGSRLILYDPRAVQLGNSGNSVDLSCAVDDGSWHFLAVTSVPIDAQNDQITVWVDGVERGQMMLYHDTGVILPAGMDMILGGKYLDAYDTSFFCGGLAEFQIWQGALTTDKIQALMQAPPDPLAESNLRLLVLLRQADVLAGNVQDLVGKYCGPIQVLQLT